MKQHVTRPRHRNPWECFGIRVIAARGEYPAPLNNRNFCAKRRVPLQKTTGPPGWGLDDEPITIFQKRQLITETQLLRNGLGCIFQSNLLPVLLYGAELWRLTNSDELKLNRFHHICLNKIMRVRWPMKIPIEELYCLTNTKPVSEIIRERRWRYIGHIFRRETSSNLRVALTQKPEGRRRRGRRKET